MSKLTDKIKLWLEQPIPGEEEKDNPNGNLTIGGALDAKVIKGSTYPYSPKKGE